ncbi:acyl-CoA thioesterase [Actinocrispum wychmicini]|uniref:Acyl-CoA thioester hydrolase n=1 Tax=Actinocrispum wychmicini TaxID=1213861 RepID=A0A4R2J1U3_9PSEU|nr:thioesterase family protein [Actinocrispum wychmicini]TCO50738.1 acyl-CoA thioester hydrolase [Actinocrispum wychmicini]
MFVHRLRVRYSECDQQGVVFNANYLAYYDVALTELWRARVCLYQEMIDKGDDLVVAESRLRFLRPGRFDDEIDIAMDVHHLGTTSLIVHPVFRVGDTVITEGEMRHVFVDPATLAKKPIPDYVRNGLTSG